MLKQRVITALWMAIPLLVVVWLGDYHPLLAFVVALFGLCAVIEFYRMAEGLKIKPQKALGIILTLLFISIQDAKVANFAAGYINLSTLISAFITFGIIFSLIGLLTRKQKFNAFPAWAWTWAGIFYVGWLLGYIINLRQLDNGRNWLFLALFATIASDVFAFFVGRAIGKHKMAPAISPSKTWEGATGGLLGSAVMSILFLLPTPLTLNSQLNWWQAVILGMVISVFAQIGDLVESVLKRNTGVKDSGTIFPGHGGALDRIDSVIFAVVVVYYWVLWLVK